MDTEVWIKTRGTQPWEWNLIQRVLRLANPKVIHPYLWD